MKQLSVFLLFSILSLGTMAQQTYLLIGTYTGSGSKGIYVYRFNGATGEAEWVSNTDAVVNPSYLAVGNGGQTVYAVNETNGNNPGKVSAFHFDKSSGALHFINQQLTGGDDPCYVALNKKGTHVAVGNYSGGNLSIYAVEPNGALSKALQTVQHEGSSANKSRQEKAHVHATVFSPDQNYLLAPDLGTDKVMVYRFNPNGKTVLQPHTPAYVASTLGSGPRHITFHPNGKFAYLIEELTGTVVAYQYKEGRLTFVQRIATHPKEYKGAPGSADIHLSPDGKFLYASNRGDENNLALFAVQPATGKLTAIGYQSTMGKTPRNFMIDPSGNYLLVANQNSDNIVIFKRDKATGLLQATGQEIKVPKPVCLKMIP